jgi:Dynein heavy chain region D6 P-loop domain
MYIQGMDRRLHLVSLGQGQGVKAEEVLSAAAETGNWVMLQNCHLAQSWLPQLQRFGKCLCSACCSSSCTAAAGTCTLALAYVE